MAKKTDNTMVLVLAAAAIGIYLYMNTDPKTALIARLMQLRGQKDTDIEESTKKPYKEFYRGYSVQQLQLMIADANNVV